VQAEDELAAAGIVIGAGWAGARAFTPTSGPGISLMSEFIGLAYYAEIPGVFFDVQRTGPSTGMPTRTQQGDLLSVAYASHGDTKHIALFPADPGSASTMAVQAFDLAERFQTPVFVVSDLDIGMNDWMCPRLTWDDAYRPDRGKVLDARGAGGDRALLPLPGRGRRRRGRAHAAGRAPERGVLHPRLGHDKHAGYTEDAARTVEVVDRLARKLRGGARGAAAGDPRAAPGAAHRDRLHRRVPRGGARGVDRLAPPGVAATTCASAASRSPPRCGEFLRARTSTFVVEQNRDAQLRSLLILETGVSERLLSGARLRRDAAERRRGGGRLERPSPRSARMTSIAKPPVSHPASAPTRSGSRAATTRGRCPPSAPGAGTIR
jgi:2-oxoglutarate/2-oxoacid ferredoxin oxidoreductase subunit alpha